MLDEAKVTIERKHYKGLIELNRTSVMANIQHAPPIFFCKYFYLLNSCCSLAVSLKRTLAYITYTVTEKETFRVVLPGPELLSKIRNDHD